MVEVDVEEVTKPAKPRKSIVDEWIKNSNESKVEPLSEKDLVEAKYAREVGLAFFFGIFGFAGLIVVMDATFVIGLIMKKCKASRKGDYVKKQTARNNRPSGRYKFRKI